MLTEFNDQEVKPTSGKTNVHPCSCHAPKDPDTRSTPAEDIHIKDVYENLVRTHAQFVASIRMLAWPVAIVFALGCAMIGVNATFQMWQINGATTRVKSIANEAVEASKKARDDSKALSEELNSLQTMAATIGDKGKITIGNASSVISQVEGANKRVNDLLAQTSTTYSSIESAKGALEKLKHEGDIEIERLKRSYVILAQYVYCTDKSNGMRSISPHGNVDIGKYNVEIFLKFAREDLFTTETDREQFSKSVISACP